MGGSAGGVGRVERGRRARLGREGSWHAEKVRKKLIGPDAIENGNTNVKFPYYKILYN